MLPNRRLTIVAFMLAGLVAGLYAVYFVSVGKRLQDAVISRKVGTRVEEWLKGLG